MRKVALLLVVGVVAALPLQARADDPVKITDVYIPMDDGVRLAADVYLPPGTPTDGSAKVPCLVELTPYRKESRAAEGVAFAPPNGFGLIEVDARGTGGSEGEYDIVFSLREQYDTARVIDWAAERSGFCGERVGMFGGSYSGIIQYLVASLDAEHASPYLAAIAPQRAYGDLYRDIVYHGGLVIGSFGLAWSTGTSAFYTQPPTNVQTDQGRRSWTDHLTQNDPMMANYLSNPYADATFTWTNASGPHSQRLYEDSSILPRIANLRVPTLHLAGWFDAFTRGQIMTFQAALAQDETRGPNYLIVGPWNHAGTHFVNPPHFTDRLTEWYRHWLAGGPRPAWFDDGRVLYNVTRNGTVNDETGEWRTATSWPPPGLALTRKYLGGAATLADAPSAGSDTFVYNPSAGTAEVASRWDNAAFGVAYASHDQRTDGPKGLTYSTPVLSSDVTLAGPIMLDLDAATTGVAGNPDLASVWPGALQLQPPYHDTDWVVKLSDVAPDGRATLITAGYLRASHRAIDPARSGYVDGELVSPYHPHTLAALDPPVPGEVRNYKIEVWPTARTFQAGHAIRIDVYSADTPNHLGLMKPAVNTIMRTSSLLLPIVPSGGPM